jgi:hypothetical protein
MHTWAASWVDYNNDGRIDLYTMPRGLFLQTSDRRFTPTNRFAITRKHLYEARCTWFDADNDGRRDLLMYAKWVTIDAAGKRTPSIKSSVHRNRTSGNHWLQIVLRGPPSNRFAIGAQVWVTTSKGTEMSQVGSAEGSHFSQGHYRLYFGLGSHRRVDSIRILWPDGREEIREDIAADQLLEIPWPEVVAGSSLRASAS